MVDKEKLKLMIDLAEYEEKHGKKNYIINSYFQFDYVERHMMGGFVAYTLCFLLVFALIVFYKFDEISNQTNILVILDMFKPYLTYYAIGLLVYELIIIIVYSLRYSHGKREVRIQSNKLKKLNKKYYAE